MQWYEAAENGDTERLFWMQWYDAAKNGDKATMQASPHALSGCVHR